ncbi:hypothetical protein [Acidithiobacillus marinus]|uniref:hypothetical protein n=1 Tax=Acidithiobacillus marinus TaxID=187490 RepID=UPI00209BC15E|nr:hypothetical protein [Acidithiobacillus marinus]
MNHNRKEPVLEEALEENEDAPLLLTKMVREGLPPPLWRHEEPAEPVEPAKSQSQQFAENPGNKAAPTENTFAMQWEEAQSPAGAVTHPAAAPHHTQSTAYLQDSEITQPSKTPKDFEDNDLEAALARMREGLSQFTASKSETAADENMSAAVEPPVFGIVSDRLKPALEDSESTSSLTSPEDQEPEPLPTDHADPDEAVETTTLSAAKQEDPDPVSVAPTAEKTPVESVSPEPENPVEASEETARITAHSAHDPALEKTAFDLDFLKEFEQLLFQEIERRVMNEMEEQMIEHLQKVWKEQLSLTMMRTLALEGIKLRESLAQEMRKSLPEILQRVLHNGLEQIIPTEAD